MQASRKWWMWNTRMHISITLPLRSDHGPPCSLLWADTNGSQNILWRQKIMIALIIDFGQMYKLYPRSESMFWRYHMPWKFDQKVLFSKFHLKFIPPTRVNLQNFNISCILYTLNLLCIFTKIITYPIHWSALIM